MDIGGVEEFRTFMRALRAQNQHYNRYVIAVYSERRIQNPLLDSGTNKKAEYKLARYSDECEAEVQYLIAVESYRRLVLSVLPPLRPNVFLVDYNGA